MRLPGLTAVALCAIAAAFGGGIYAGLQRPLHAADKAANVAPDVRVSCPPQEPRDVGLPGQARALPDNTLALLLQGQRDTGLLPEQSDAALYCRLRVLLDSVRAAQDEERLLPLQARDKP